MLVLGNGSITSQSAPTVQEIPAFPDPSGPNNVVLTQQFGASFAPGVYQWSAVKQRWVFLYGYEQLCTSFFSIADAYVCLPNAGATLLPIGSSGEAAVAVTRNGISFTAYTLSASGVELGIPAQAGDVFFVARHSLLKPETLIVPGGISEAPSDGSAYVREDAAWVTLSSVIPVATTSAAGVVSVGDNLTVDSTGRLSAVTFNPVPATTTTIGGIIVGANLTVDENGVLSGTPHVSPANTTSLSGPVAVQGTAVTFMRSDAAPAINLAATYPWTGGHTFAQPVQVASLTVTGSSQLQALTATSVTATAMTVGTTSITNGSITVGVLNSETVVNSASLTTGSATIGNATFSGTVSSSASQPSAGDSSTLVPTTAWVQSAIAANPGGLPIASATVLGGIKVGANLSIGSDGTLSASDAGGGGVPANPSGTVGLATVDGVLSTFMRSDAAPALSQAIAPTWTAQHTFQLTPISTAAQPGTADSSTKMPTTAWVQSVVGANAYALPPATTTTLGGVIVGENLLVDENGVLSWQVVLAPSAPSALVGLTPVTGVATTYLSSDSAPALDQSISPTWTGPHTFISSVEVGGAASLTVTGSQTRQLIFDGPSTAARATEWRTAGIERWRLTMSNTETGSNVGSDFQVFRFSDAGTFVDTPLSITRATGITTFSERPMFSTATPWDSLNLPYPLSTTVAASTYLPLAGGTLTGNLNGTTVSLSGSLLAAGGTFDNGSNGYSTASNFTVTDGNASNAVNIYPNLPGASYNSLVQAGDAAVIGGAGAGTGNLTLAAWVSGAAASGIRLTPTSTTIAGTVAVTGTSTFSGASTWGANTSITVPAITLSGTTAQPANGIYYSGNAIFYVVSGTTYVSALSGGSLTLLGGSGSSGGGMVINSAGLVTVTSGLTVEGAATLEGATVTAPAASDNSTAVPSTAWVNSAIAASITNPTYGNITVTGTAQFGGPIQVTSIVPTGSAPTAAVGTGAGTGGSVTAVGAPMSGQFSVSTGTNPAAGGTVATLTFIVGNTFSTAPHCIVSAASPGSALLYVTSYISGGTLTLTFGMVNNEQLSPDASYTWNWWCP
jgi:hypothetical protein